MNIVVNGETTELDAPTTVAQLIARVGLEGKPCAVEVNRTLVPRKEHGAHELTDGDSVELVTLVGGG